MTATLLASFPSPAQGVWFLGPFPVRAYALCIIAGIVAALVIGDRRWAARGGEPGVIYDIALWAVTFGLVGGRLYHVLTDWNTYFGPDGAGFGAALRIWDGGLGIWGAVALGGVGAWIACRRRGIPLPAFGDAIAPGIILAQAIGRLGNYFNQELYGRETTLPWGLEIYERRNASGAVDFLNGVSTGQLLEVVHPTFLYELLWNLLVFVALLVIDRRFNIGHGRVFALYVAGYCVGRFWIELLRSDFATEIAGVRVNSFTATFVFIGAVVYIMAAPRGREDPATLRGKQDAAAEGLVKDLAVGASTTGVVAAATVAAEEDRAEDDVAAESSVEDSDSVVGAEGEEAAEEAAADGAASEEEPAVGGVGSVDEGELGEAVADASEAHEVAVEAEAEAGELAAEEDRAEGDVAAESSVEDAEVAVGGVGSVDGGELGEAVADASEAHEVAVAGEAEAGELAAEEDRAEDDAAAESSVEGAEVAVGGVGSVDEGELGEAVADASEAHEAAVEAEAEADAVADEAADEAVSADEPAVGGVGSVDEDELDKAVADASVAHDMAVDGEAEVDGVAAAEAADAVDSDAKAAADEAAALAQLAAGEPSGVGGLGSVEGDEANDVREAISVEDEESGESVAAADVDDSALVEGQDAAEAVTDSETGAGETGEDDESGESVVEVDVDESALVEGQDAAEALTDTGADEDAEADQPDEHVAPPVLNVPPPPSAAQRAAEMGTRVRQWVRRRRNR